MAIKARLILQAKNRTRASNQAGAAIPRVGPGSRNKVSEKLLEALASDFEDHGKDVIEKVRAERPADYLKIVASLVPKQMEIDDLRTSRRAEDLSDNELAAIALERLNGHPNLDG